MLNQIIVRRFGISHSKANVLTHLMLLAASIMGLNVIAYTTASSLFLAHVGSQKLPICYVGIGLLSIPAYTAFSHWVAHYSSSKLFQFLLLGSILMTGLMRFLLTWETSVGYYILFITFYFHWVIQLDILFPSVASDYLTALEYKRYAGWLGMAEAVGGLLGGAMTSVLAAYLSSADMLLILPLLLGGAIALLVNLNRSAKRLEADEDQIHHWLLKDLKTFARAISPAPIAIFLAVSTFCVIIIQTIAEIQYLGIYSLTFPSERQLTSVLGLLWSVNNIVQLLVLQFFTSPMLQWQGVSRMNLAYPLITLASFLGLAVHFKLPFAIFAHLNRDALDRGINRPIHTLHYNAVPHQLASQVRAIADGLFFSLGLSVAGALLWLSESRLDPFQMTAIGIALSVILLALRYFMGKSYLRSLLATLRSSSTHLTALSKTSTDLTEISNERVFQLLGSRCRPDLLLGLELATRLDNPRLFLAQVKAVLSKADSELTDCDPLVCAAVFKFLGVVGDRSALPQLGQGLAHLNLGVRLQAASALAHHGECSLKIASSYLRSPRLEVVEAAIAAIARVGTRRAETILYDYFKPSFRLLNDTRRWLRLIPDEAEWNPLKIGLHDFHQRLCHQVLYALSSLDRPGTFLDVRQVLYGTNPRARANAIEVLASGRNRRFVLPVMPLLECQQAEPLPPTSPTVLTRMLQKAMVCGDRWIEIGAFIAAEKNFPYKSLFSFIGEKYDPLVKPIIAYLSLHKSTMKDDSIDQLFFLKNVTLFKELFLEDILQIQKHLKQSYIFSGEPILTTENNNDSLYVIDKGVVNFFDVSYSSLIPISCLHPTEYFGEMALLEESQRGFSVVAKTDCTLLILSRESFRIVVDSCPRFLTALAGNPSRFV